MRPDLISGCVIVHIWQIFMNKKWQVFTALIITIVFAEICASNHYLKDDSDVANPERPISMVEAPSDIPFSNVASANSNYTNIPKSDDATEAIDSHQAPEPVIDPEIEMSRDQEGKLGDLRDWARQHPEEALTWALHQPDGPERHEVLADVCFQLAQSDPASAVSMAQQFHLGQGQGAVTENLIQQWAGEDINAAYSWLQEQPPGEEKDSLMMSIAFVWSQTNPADAAQLVVEQITPGTVQTEAAMTVLHQWAQQDISSAIAWANQFPAGSLRDRALAELSGIESRQMALAASGP
jgi:hypothetical protein